MYKYNEVITIIYMIIFLFTYNNHSIYKDTGQYPTDLLPLV